MIQRLNEKQVAVLKALGTYKFLTYSQMIRLGIDKHKSNLSHAVNGLVERRGQLVRKIPHRPGSEAKFYLSSKGKQALEEIWEGEENQIHCPKGIITTDTQDQKHRTSIVSLHIELVLACEEIRVELLWCDRYFDKIGDNRSGKNLQAKNALLYEGDRKIIPDMTFMLETSKQRELYLLELENGKDTKKAVHKCGQHAKAILLGSANKKYGHQSGYRTLWVFEHESTMLATQERVCGSPFFQHLHEYFLFLPLSSALEGSFFEGWKNLAGASRQIYYI